MAQAKYQYGTSPRKVETVQKKNNKRKKVTKQPNLKVVKELPRQEIKISKEQRTKQIKLTIMAIAIFGLLLTISYRNSQITVEFNEMQAQKKELASIQKENEQLKINIENSLNLNNIEKEAKEQLGMQKLTNKQTVYVSLPKKDYIESASEKVVIEEEKSWWESIVQKFTK